ncbi:hypothetical protein GCM10022407_17870 [Hymenobacter antarcticus]|uniref:Uncharacterized protein n=1 Tax=Hymenobacter antarcticus TaxID=486270 RepID=A0ABP7PWX4_9BACT
MAGNEILGGLGRVGPGNQGANIGIFNWKGKPAANSIFKQAKNGVMLSGVEASLLPY